MSGTHTHTPWTWIQTLTWIPTHGHMGISIFHLLYIKFIVKVITD